MVGNIKVNRLDCILNQFGHLLVKKLSCTANESEIMSMNRLKKEIAREVSGSYSKLRKVEHFISDVRDKMNDKNMIDFLFDKNKDD